MYIAGQFIGIFISLETSFSFTYTSIATPEFVVFGVEVHSSHPVHDLIVVLVSVHLTTSNVSQKIQSLSNEKLL